MSEGINVVSLFDGISCGQLALQRSNIPVNNYFASEINKHTIKIANKNFPNTKQLGDVQQLKFIDWGNIDGGKINLLIGGSPCQGLSFAGKMLNFDDPRSKLFFEYVRILKEIRQYNPDVKFLLENVRMNKKSQDTISELLGVQPIAVNSSLVSAQNRYRLYWTNIEGFVIPEDRGITLQDIVEDGGVYFGGAIRGRYDSDGKVVQQFETNKQQKSNALTSVQKDNVIFEIPKLPETLTAEDFSQYKWLSPDFFEGTDARCYFCEERGQVVFVIPEATKKGYVEVVNGDFVDLEFLNSKSKRGRLKKSKGNCVTQKLQNHCVMRGDWFRKLSPIEYERLQTLPDNYTEGISDTQRYSSIGNGWTIDIIVEFLKNLKTTT